MDVHLIFMELACSPYLGWVLLDRYSLPSETLENGSFEKGELAGSVEETFLRPWLIAQWCGGLPGF